MFDNRDMDDAVRDGVISRDAVRALRNRAAQARHAPLADEERFDGGIALADVMASIGLCLVLGVLVGMAFGIAPLFVGLVAALCWGLAEYFTRRRRQILASFVLFLFFALTVSMTALGVGLMAANIDPSGGQLAMRPTGMPVLPALIVAAAAAMGCAVWWLRFRLPIAFAAAIVALINIFVHGARIVAPQVDTGIVGIVLLLFGLGLFGVAMWWDMSDVRRETIRADVAFWLHAAAGFQIAGASYRLLFGVEGSPLGWERLYSFTPQPATEAAIPVAMLLLGIFCWIALVVDRRSLFMSAMLFLVKMQLGSGLLAVGLPVTLLLLGGVLITLSIFWSQLRALAIAPLPLVVRAQLPRDAVTFGRDRPVY